MLIDLKPFGERGSSVYTVIRRIGKRVADIPNIALHLQARRDLTIGARVSKTQFQYTLRDPNLNELRHWAPIMLESLRKIPQIRDVEADIDPAAPGVTVQLDRDAMARLDVTTQAVDDTLYDAYGQRQVASYFTQLNVYRTILEVDPRLQLDENALKNALRPVPLGLAGPTRRNQPSRAFRCAVDREPRRAIPGGHTVVQSRARRRTRRRGRSGILYESYIHPLTILSTLPSAGIGGLLALMLLHYDFSLIALIGVILLIGIVKKNGIMMVDQAQGATPRFIRPR
jgi:multidrug efflux pump subunit AcrB